MTAPRPVPVALTIAGSDSGGGAGIQADLKTFTVLGVYGASVVTAITAQNTLEVRRTEALSPDLVAAQLDAVLEDIGCDAAKTGMLVTTEIVELVAERIRAHGVTRLVVDPVMRATGGETLLADSAIAALIGKLLPLALVVTPNLREASVLTGRPVTTLAEMREAAKALADLGAGAVIVKGGHLPGRPVDLLYLCDDGDEILLEGERHPTENTHGTGCTFSAAITAELAKGADLIAAARAGKQFVSLAIEHSLPLGAGRGPTNVIEAGRRTSSHPV